MTKDTVYIERANGAWEAWTYCDGDRVYLGRFVHWDDFYVTFGSKRYHLVVVKD